MTKVSIPDPLQNDSQYDRYYHFDIPNLELNDIRDELYALRPLLWGLPKGDWIRERVGVLENELARRQYAKRGRK